MTTSSFDPSLLLFVPGDRPDRFVKALAAGGTGAILDLEDAVAPDRKAQARDAVRDFLNAHGDLSRLAVRINPVHTSDGERDLAMLARAARPAAILVPKADAAELPARVAERAGPTPQIALIETARGLVHCEAIAAAPQVLGLAFGPYDLSAELGCASDAGVLSAYRARMLVAARAAERWAIDGPSREYADAAIPARDAALARRTGFDGKLLIHPAQIAPVRAAFAPDEAEVAYARRIVAAAALSSPGVLDGTMIDTPILRAAERTLARAQSGAEGTLRA